MEQLILEKFSSQEIIDFGLQQVKGIMDGCGDTFYIAAMVFAICIIFLIILLSSDKFHHWFIHTVSDFVFISYVVIFVSSIVVGLFSAAFYYSAECDYNKMLNSPEPIAVTTALEYWGS